MKDDVRLFRVREDAVKDEFKNKRDKPLTEEEAEQMWKNVSCRQIKIRIAKWLHLLSFRIVHRGAGLTLPRLMSATGRETPGWTSGGRGTPK